MLKFYSCSFLALFLTFLGRFVYANEITTAIANQVPKFMEPDYFCITVIFLLFGFIFFFMYLIFMCLKAVQDKATNTEKDLKSTQSTIAYLAEHLINKGTIPDRDKNSRYND